MELISRPDRPNDSQTHGQRQKIEANRRFEASRLRGLLISADHLSFGDRRLPAMVAAREFEMKHGARPFQKKTAATVGNTILRAPTGNGRLKRLCFGLGLMKLKMGVCFTSYPLRQQSTPCIRGLAIAFQARENLSECFTAGQLTICIRKCCRTILPTAFVLRRRQELARSWPRRCTTQSL